MGILQIKAQLEEGLSKLDAALKDNMDESIVKNMFGADEKTFGLPRSYWQNRPARTKPSITEDMIEVDSEDNDWSVNQ